MPIRPANRGRNFRRNGLLTFLSMSLLTGCHFLGPKKRSTEDAAPIPVSATWHHGAASTFKLPTTAEPKTSREDLFRLVDALDKAYEMMDFAAPHPAIRIVDARHDILDDGGIGAATIDEDGKEYIYVNRDYLASGAPLAPLVIHELSHLKAWRVHGLQIAYHGKEYKEICHAFTARSHCKAVRLR
jgi:hypothetical protein